MAEEKKDKWAAYDELYADMKNVVLKDIIRKETAFIMENHPLFSEHVAAYAPIFYIVKASFYGGKNHLQFKTYQKLLEECRDAKKGDGKKDNAGETKAREVMQKILEEE